MSLCLGDRLDGASWTGLPLGRFAPPPHDGLMAVASTQHTLFVWADGASAATVQTRRGTVHYQRGAGVMDLMASGEEARIAHDRPDAAGQALVIALPSVPPGSSHAATGQARDANGSTAGRTVLQTGTPAAGQELRSRFNLRDSHLHALALALRAHCIGGQPYGRIYTDSLSLALSACVFARYSAAADRRRAVAAPHAAALAVGPSGHELPGGDTAGGFSFSQRAMLVSYIDAHLASDLGLDELAATVGYSRPHFVRLFRRSFHMSPHQWVMRLRLERAKQLLQRDDASLAEIAAACGFSDASHLGHCFARSTGESPGRYKRRAAALWEAPAGGS